MTRTTLFRLDGSSFVATMMFALLLFLCCCCCSFISAQDDQQQQQLVAANAGSLSTNNNNPHRRLRSIFQACRKDIERICVGEDKRGEERRTSLRQAAACLEEKVDQIQDNICKSWLDARKTCFADVEKDGICPGAGAAGSGKFAAKDAVAKRGRVMMCLRTIDVEKLSEGCVGSDFYKAIVGLRRFNRQNRMSARDKTRRDKLNKMADNMQL